MAAAPDFPDDLATLWFLVHRVAGLMDRAGEALFRRGLSVSLAQFLVLSVVDAYPGDLNQQAIADRLGLTKGTVSRQIDNAVAAGRMTVQVSERTRRENHIALTPAGKTLSDAATPCSATPSATCSRSSTTTTWQRPFESSAA